MISYHHDRPITSEQFVDLLKRSTLAERRPVDQPERIDKMLQHANLLITAWHNDELVGVSRALTDFAFCCYVSDLAVDKNFQRQGIGKTLLDETQKQAGPQTTLLLLAAPAAVNYYPRIGMQHFEHCFINPRKPQ